MTTVRASLDAMRRFLPNDLYAVLDPTDDERIAARIELLGARAVSLFNGSRARLASVAPHLVSVDEDLLGWITETVWDDPWGVFVASSVGASQLQEHLEAFLQVSDSQGSPMYFRYYDPRVLEPFLEVSTDAEAWMFFGPVDAFYISNPGKRTLSRLFPHSEMGNRRCGLPGGQLFRVRQGVSAALAEVPMRVLEDKTLSFISGEYAAQVEALGESEVREVIRYGFERGEQHAMATELQLVLYVDFMFQFGRDFDVDPELPWASACLSRGSAYQRLERLMASSRVYSERARGLVGDQPVVEPDAPQLLTTLATLSPPLQVAFAAGCAERVLAIGELEAGLTQPGRAVNLAWDLALGANPNGQILSELGAELETTLQHDDLDLPELNVLLAAASALGAREGPEAAATAAAHAVLAVEHFDDEEEELGEEQTWQRRALAALQSWGDRPMQRDMLAGIDSGPPGWLRRQQGG